MKPSYLTEETLYAFIKQALDEDLGNGDHSSLGSIPEKAASAAKLLVKGDGILAGIEMAKAIFYYFDPNLEVVFHKNDGDEIASSDIAFTIKGNARSILATERLVLNCMQRMSGIATYTHYLNSLIKGTNCKLLDTRKTTPNFRLAEKWAVTIGGGFNHRFGLYDMVMLKDNHIDFAGGVKQAIEKTNQYLTERELNLKIVVEVRSLKELDEVLEVGKVHRVLLDNMLPSQIKDAIEKIQGRFETEASGGVTEKTISEIAEAGVDYISVGALTHSFTSLDMSLKAL